MKISVLGCGRWGTFLAWYSAKQGHDVTLWGRTTSSKFNELKESRKNEYLELLPNIELNDSLEYAIEESKIIIISISAQNLRSFAKTISAYNRAKTCERVLIAELARRFAGKITSVAFNPTFIIDKSDPELKKRWPKGFTGFIWWMSALLFSKPPVIAGEPIANLMLTVRDRSAINGALFKLDKRIKKPDKAMNDKVLGKRLWDELVLLTR